MKAIMQSINRLSPLQIILTIGVGFLGYQAYKLLADNAIGALQGAGLVPIVTNIVFIIGMFLMGWFTVLRVGNAVPLGTKLFVLAYTVAIFAASSFLWMDHVADALEYASKGLVAG